MLITNHVLSGALIGLGLRRRPVAAAAVGMVSHFALDASPHWGVKDERVFLRVAVADGLCGLATLAWAVRRTPPGRRAAVLAGIAGACLPDADKPALLFFGRIPFPRRFEDFHIGLQNEAPHRMPVEIRVAVGLAAVTALAAGWLRRREA